ncbi:hypothetical protein PYW08_016547 [Mythimna loreyi]|uniref:Uncharacterized protein n=1 Tax=Mythimna loreyi TaxID=667449 RepID=A0ACC2QZQ0_9NEOP|nr:hypothetical protein PYW08_016547 [Mythimna loreyi]
MDITFRRFWKLYAIIIFSFIVEATSSNNNETSPERRQSRVTGRIVKLYSGTRPEPILCAGEGFQADPRDCAVFYRCMKSGSGKYTVFRFQCGPGTVYDPDTEVCNHPRSTKRSECGGLPSPPLPVASVDGLNNNDIEEVNIQNEIPSPISNTPIGVESTTGAKATFTTLNPWSVSSLAIHAQTPTKRQTSEVSTISTSLLPGSTVGYTSVDNTVNQFNLAQNTVTKNQQHNMVSKTTSLPTMSAAIPQSNSRENVCSSDGFMGDSENCRKFYRCVANQRGTYTRFEFSCSETTVWDDDTQSCNHAWAVKRSRCGRSNQDNLFTTNAEIPQRDSSTDKTIQQQLQISYGTKVNQTQTQISNGSSVIQNQTQINYGDRLGQNKKTKAKQNQTQISHGSAVSQAQTQIDFSDKGFQTQLQIDHSKQASQTQTQIHESTTSSSSLSTSSSTNHVNNQKDNRCERSGFMGDSNDCKKFYRCVDNGRGGYAKFDFSCGEGTVWDQSIEACNHVWAVKDCGGKGSAQTVGTTEAAISTSHSTQNYFPTTSNEPHHTTSEHVDTEDNEDSGYGQQNQNPTTSSSTTLSSTTLSSTTASSTTEKSSSNGNGNCQSSGFMGDANDCKIFYRCVENGKGSFTKYEFKCGEGTVWDSDIEACNHAWAVKRCGGNASTDINNIETTTEQQNTPSTAHTQSTIVTQSSTESGATQNDDYDTGYGSANNEVTSSTTSTSKKPQNGGQNVNNICTSSGFMGDENDCKKFYRCVDNGNGGYTRYEFTCGEGTVWDSKIDACNHAWAVEKCGGSTINQEATTQAKPITNHEVTDSSSTEGNINAGSSTLLPITTSSTSIITESVSTSSNECTKSGFMGDQKDCKKFYRCVDNGQGSFTKYEFSCGEGTVWDQKIEACNHAWAVEKCGGSVGASTGHYETTTQFHPTMSDEIDNGYPSNIDTGTQITTQSTSTHSTSESTKPSGGNNCINSGFIGDQNDCKKFYRCVDDGNGKYTRYEFTCGEGTLWDQSIEACNHAWAVKDCGKLGNQTAHPSSESPTQGTLTTETEDLGYPQSTEKTSTLTTNGYPESESGEACSQEGFMGDKKNCKKFYRCVDNGRGGFTKYEFTCGEGTYWNQEILSCDHATSDKTCGEKESSSTTQTSRPIHDEIYTEETSMSSSTTEGFVNEQTQRPAVSSGTCTSEGFYGDQNDCKKFYRCVDNGKGGYTKYDFACGDGTIWDQEMQTCNHESSNKKCSLSSPPNAQTTEHQPSAGNDISMTTESQIQHSTEKTNTSSTSTSSSNQCSSEGFFADPNDCKKFIRCVSNEKGGYTKYEFTCGEGTIWVQDILACDHDTGDAICSTQTTSKPSGTEGQHQTTQINEVSTSTSEPQTIDKQEDEYDNGNSNKPSQPGSGDCSSEGFYANKNDCRQFYRCVDNGQGGFTKYDFTCGEGTAWDSEIQTCNHIDQVKTCHGASETQPVMHDEDNSPSTESSSTTASDTTSSGSTTTSATSSGSTTTSATSSGSTTTSATFSGSTTTTATSSSTTASGTNNQGTSGNKDTCESEGFFGNTQDCKKFYRCVDNGNGGYTKYDFDCGEGTIWDQDVTTCNHPRDVVNPSCNQKQDGSTTSTTAASSSSTSESSSSNESSSPPGSSTTTLSSSQTTTESSQGSTNCSQEETSKKPSNQNITCDKAGYFANPNDCKKFYRCVDWDGDGKRFSVYHFDCGEGTIWDPAVETCNHEDSVYPPRDCSGSQSQSGNPPATEGTTTAKQETTSTQESTSTQTTSTTESSTEQTTQSTTSQPTTSSEKTTTTQQTTISEKPTTQQSTTSQPTTTQKSTTSEQTTQQSTTSEQTTQQSTTSEQTTQQSTTSEQTTKQPTSEQTTTQLSTTAEQTTTQQSTSSEQTTTQQSTTSEQTTTEQSTPSEQTTTQQSSTSKQTTQNPTTSEQTTETTTTTEQSTTSEPTTTEQSTTSESTTEQSTSTSESSTSEQSTTEQSTATEQSTTEETTTSEGITTELSATEQSTTEQTNESSTTESGTDESTSENKCPETDENQSLFVCPTSFKRHPKYCNLFYQCDEDDDTHDVKIAVFTCPNNTIYDESQTRCVEESKADKKCDGKIAQKRRFRRFDKHYKEPLVVTKDSHACPSAGYFSFEKDSECSPAFLKCKTDKTNKLRGLVHQCPTGYLYWSISKRCEPMNKVKDCRRSQNNWTGRWEIPVERRNVAPS